MKLGLKVWSTNLEYESDIESFYKQKIFDFIEIYFVPTSIQTHAFWTKFDIPLAVHAPHGKHGLNLSNPESEDTNRQLLTETKQFADFINADYIVVHPGVDGQLQESIRQLKLFCDPRFLVENKPYYVGTKQHQAVGASASEVEQLLAATKLGFCLDIGHAICAANALQLNWEQFIRQLLTLKPKVIHLCDGMLEDVTDFHHHLGEGNYPFNKIFPLIKNEDRVLLETNKKYPDKLVDFKADVDYFNQLLRQHKK